MSQFIRLIDHGIIDFFVQKAEDLGYCRDQFLKDPPYLLCDGELYGLSGNLPEEAADSLVVAETFGNGEDVVLQTAQSRGCNLGGEAGALTFAEAKVGLAILEHDFKRPASGIYLPCLEEIQPGVGRKQSVPFAMLGPADEEYPYRHSVECGVKHDIVAFEFAAVLLELEFLAQLDKRRCREVSMPGMVFCLSVLADLDHAEPMAFDVTAMDEPDNLLVGKPAVGQDVTELHTFADGSFYHLFGKFYLGHVVFLLPLAEHFAVMFGSVTPHEFFFTHAIVPFFALLPDDGEIKKNLGNSVGDGHTETFESEHGLVGQMGVNTADFLDGPACLLMVGVVKNQTDIVDLMVGTHMYAVPQLDGYMPESLSPVYIWIFHKPIKDIFPCLDQWLENAVLLIAVRVFDAETREEQKALKNGEQPIHAVTLACDGKRVTLGHPDLGENGTYALHGGCHIIIFEKIFDIREKRCNFVYRHGLEYIFVWHLKFTHFLAFRQESMSFFLCPYLWKSVLAKLKLIKT